MAQQAAQSAQAPNKDLGPDRLIDKANWPMAILCTLLFGAGVWAVNFSPIGVARLLQITGGASILDFEFGYNNAEAFIILTKLGEAGRDFYMGRILPLDFAFPITYALCYGNWAALMLKKVTLNPNAQYWLMVPIGAMLADWVENVCVFTMLWHFPNMPGWAVTVASVAGMVKYVLIAASILMVAVLVVLRIRVGIQNKKAGAAGDAPAKIPDKAG